MSSEEILQKIASSAGGVFRFGRGLVGKSSIAVTVFLGVAGVTIYGLADPLFRIGALLVAAIVFSGWFCLILRYAHKYPETTLLEGAEWTTWKQIELGAKGLLQLPEAPVIPDPQGEPIPPSETESGPDK